MDILLIEDEQKTADALKKGLEESGYSVDVAYDGQSGFSLLANHQYSLVISDIIMPKLNGLNLCKKIKETHSNIPVLLLTALDSKDNVITGFDAGADDYLTKPFDFRELLARVRALGRRIGDTHQEAITEEISFADIRMNIKSREVTRAGINIELTAQEFKLLEYFIRKPNIVVSRMDLARDIWNIDFETGTNVVEVYINYLRNKIDKPFKTKLIHNKHGIGYVLKDN